MVILVLNRYLYEVTFNDNAKEIHIFKRKYNFVDLTIDSWLTIDSIGTTPAVEKVCLHETEDFLEDF